MHTSIFGSLHCICLRIYLLGINFRGFLKKNIGNLVNTCVKCHQRGPRGEAVRPGMRQERMSTRARSPEVDELSCAPETQQAAGVEELVVGLEDPLEISDTEQGDIGLETQQESDTSNEDTQDTQAAAEEQGHRQGQG